MAGSRAVLAPSLSLLLFLGTAVSFAQPAAAQTMPAPPFAVGSATLYCHASEDDLTVWMNTLVDDGSGVPYYITGESAATDPVAGIGVDPVAQEAVDVHIPLTPASTQAIVVKGTVTVQAFIGSGAYGGGIAHLGASLVVGTTVLGSADPVEHDMPPRNGNVPSNPVTGDGAGPYPELDLSFDVPETTIPAGAPLEWVISGTIDAGNNVFLACHEARGRSNIVLPVLAAESLKAAPKVNATSNSTSSTGNVSVSLSASVSASLTNTTSSSTSNSTTSDKKGSPAPADLPVVVSVGVAAVLARRGIRR